MVLLAMVKTGGENVGICTEIQLDGLHVLQAIIAILLVGSSWLISRSNTLPILAASIAPPCTHRPLTRPASRA